MVRKRSDGPVREATGRAVSKALSSRGGSAFRITSDQRKAIVRHATNGRTSMKSNGSPKGE